MTISTQDLWDSLRRLDAWLEKHDYKAYDPFDGLMSYLRPLAFKKQFPQQVLQQAIRRNPFNLRPVLGIKPHRSTKGMGFLGGGYVQLYHLTGDQAYLKKAEWCFDWLMQNRSQGYPGCGWGNAFDYISRGSAIPKWAPTVVWTGLIGHEFIEAYRLLKKEEYLQVARDVGHFILHGLERFEVPNGICISYVTHKQLAIHNGNLLGARFLAELYKETGDRQYYDIATPAVRYSALAQLPTGAWYYGDAEMYHWIDN